MVFCSEVIEHIQNDELVIREMARVMKLTGVLLMTTPNGLTVPLTQQINHLHVRHYTPTQLSQLLKRHFKDVEVTTHFIFHRLINFEAGIYQSFLAKKSLGLYLLRIILCLCQSILYFGLEVFLPKNSRGYTLIAIARRPMNLNAN